LYLEVLNFEFYILNQYCPVKVFLIRSKSVNVRE